MSAPRLTREERRHVGERYQAGETMPQLAEAFAVSVGTVHRALVTAGIPRRQGQAARASGRNQNELNRCRECGRGCHPNAVKPLCPSCAKAFCQRCDHRLPAGWRTRLCPPCKWAHRYQKRGPRLCRVCGRMGARGTQRDLCAVHVKCYCSVCDQPKPPQRVNHRCTACENARKQVLYQKPGRLCAQCGEREIKTHASRCQHCLHEEYEVCRFALMHLDRPCVHCGTTLPRGRRLARCAVCQRHWDRERRKRRRALGAHRCAMCKGELALKQDTYCAGCQQMLANWRKAWHAGNPIARELGTVRPQRRWQQPAAEESAKAGPVERKAA